MPRRDRLPLTDPVLRLPFGALQSLLQSGVEVLGPIDHKGMIESIYFHDPNGIRLELTVPIDQEWNRHTRQGYADLKLWVDTKERAKREGRDPGDLTRSSTRVVLHYDEPAVSMIRGAEIVTFTFEYA